MAEKENLIKTVHAALENEPAINLHQNNIDIDIREGVLVLEGEVQDIIAKRLVPRLAAGVPGVDHLLDRLRIIPSEHRGDGAIMDSLYDALTQESAFHDHAIVTRIADEPQIGTPRDSARGIIEVSIDDGIVTLMGDVESLTHRRLAEVLAWWTPGSVDVDNRLRVVPPEEDSDEEITDALRIVMEKDPWLNAGQIGIRTQNRVVTLDGLVHSQEQSHMAECDAWYILGVHKVVNHIEVRL